jgi:pyridoxamine 5'-phosphate oxidase
MSTDSARSPNRASDNPHPDLPDLIAQLAVPSGGFTLPTPLPHQPFILLKSWLDEEARAARSPNPNALSLATIDADGTLANRIVLCRGLSVDEGFITFFTNYHGRKGRAVRAMPKAAACFHWDHSDRQARLEGTIVQSPPEESDAYFRSRRWESKLSAWVSDQSQPIASRDDLLAKVAPVLARLALSPRDLLERGNGIDIPRPPHWGGFRLYARNVELWLGGPGRMHDRAVWTRDLDASPFADVAAARAAALRASAWTATRLQP